MHGDVAFERMRPRVNENLILCASIAAESGFSAQQLLDFACDSAHEQEIKYVREKYKVSPLTMALSLHARRIARDGIAGLLNCPVDAIKILPEKSGRPTIYVNDRAYPDLSISLSHSGRRASVLVCSGCFCGVDIQQISGYDWCAIVQYMGWDVLLQNLGLAHLKDGGLHSAIPGLELAQLVSGLWVCYEASLKALGGALLSSRFMPNHIDWLSTGMGQSSLACMRIAASVELASCSCCALINQSFSLGWVVGDSDLSGDRQVFDRYSSLFSDETLDEVPVQSPFSVRYLRLPWL